MRVTAGGTKGEAKGGAKGVASGLGFISGLTMYSTGHTVVNTDP